MGGSTVDGGGGGGGGGLVLGASCSQDVPAFSCQDVPSLGGGSTVDVGGGGGGGLCREPHAVKMSQL